MDDIAEAKRRIDVADQLMAEHEAAGGDDQMRYNRICHLRQTAGALAAIALAERSTARLLRIDLLAWIT